MDITQKAIDYLMPLIQGESNPPYKNGIPCIHDFKLSMVKKSLPSWK